MKLPVSNGYDSVLVVVDRFSMMSHFIATKESLNAPKLVRLFFDQVVRIHGIPESIVSDRGPQFISRFWEEFWELVGCSPKRSSAAHPESDGQTERVNQTLEQYLRCFVNYFQDDWSSYLTFAEFAMNNSVSSSTGINPFFINYGFNPKMDNFCPKETKVLKLTEWLNELSDINLAVSSSLRETAIKMKRNADMHRSDLSFKVGDLVWLSTANLRTTRPCKKLEFRRVGPFEIIKVLSQVSYKLKLPTTMRIHPVFHISLLSLFKKPLPAPVIMEEGYELEVESILGSRLGRTGTEYLVRWKGYTDYENSWESIDHVLSCWDLVKEFHLKFRDKVHRPSTLELTRVKKFLPLCLPLKRDIVL